MICIADVSAIGLIELLEKKLTAMPTTSGNPSAGSAGTLTLGYGHGISSHAQPRSAPGSLVSTASNQLVALPDVPMATLVSTRVSEIQAPNVLSAAALDLPILSSPTMEISVLDQVFNGVRLPRTAGGIINPNPNRLNNSQNQTLPYQIPAPFLRYLLRTLT
ncbi:hypothetical protein NE237_020966 [Protea cynaroides]|uniref:Uncharacterized protein n=1 Tax=Protea cynaroides TaxID=273540 RepID=A0A9Q0H6Z1_9MAGN|nr:hypothetical protein NE237_020966 [Protea cynaroides]